MPYNSQSKIYSDDNLIVNQKVIKLLAVINKKKNSKYIDTKIIINVIYSLSIVI